MSNSGPSFWDLHWPTWQDIALGVALFVATAAVSVVMTGWILVQLPANYFAGDSPPAFWPGRHPILRFAGRTAKNLLGALLVAVGIVLSIPGVPGQGVLTILIGLMFLDLPWVRNLERRLVRWPRVLGPVNALRQRWGREPLVFE